MVAGLTGCKELEGKLVDLSPILAFTKFEEAHHTGEALARWKKSVLAVFQMDKSIGLVTEDGASNNKKANRILGHAGSNCVRRPRHRARHPLRKRRHRHALAEPGAQGVLEEGGQASRPSSSSWARSTGGL